MPGDLTARAANDEATTDEGLRAWERFWFQRSMEPGRLAALRVALFGLLGLDQLHLMTAHAWRYGADGFHVAQIPALDLVLPMPRADLQAALYLLGGFLSLRIAAGIGARGSLITLTATYCYAYFNSLLDGYQHHYLICWLLLIGWTIPWERAPGVDRPEVREARIPAWGLSLLYAQVSIVYLFTTVTKVHPSWLDGWALQRQIGDNWVREMLVSVELTFDWRPGAAFALTAIAVCAWQFLASASFVVPKLRPIACISGPLFHLMVEAIGLKIGWFSHYMIALYYLLLFPDSWYAWIAARVGAALAPLGALWRWLVRPRPMMAVVEIAAIGATAVICYVLGRASPLPGTAWVAAGIAIAVLTVDAKADGRARARLGLQVGFAALVWAVPAYGGAAYDFYRYQGGDLYRRGEIAASVAPYRAAVALKPGPDSRHEKLGRVLYELGRYDESVEVLTEAVRLNPDDESAAAWLARAEGKAARKTRGF